ncbi:hypothetical protein V8C37DRAFT_413613 [Trichoderma ceciliae]
MTQDTASAIRDDSTIAKTLRTYKNIKFSLIDDEVIKKFEEKAPDFESWTCKPRKFWNPPALQELQLPELSLDERLKSFCENAAEHKLKIEAQNLVHRLDSIIAYFRYKQRFPRYINVLLSNVEKFLGQIGISIKQADKYYELLLSGRRWLQFCYLLSHNEIDFKKFCYDNINFNNINYGVLFLELDDKIITAILEESGAKLAAKTLLSPVNPEKNNSTAAASKRARTEADLDSTRASKRTRTEADLDGTRALEHACTEDHLGIFLQAAAITGRNITASETAIANLDSGPYSIQLNNALSPNSEFINLVLE